MIPQLKGLYQDATPGRVTATADVSAADVVVVENRVGVSIADAATGEDFIAVFGTDVHGIEMPHAAVACARHADAYWDADGNPVGGVAGSGAVTNVATGNIRIGRFAEAAAAGDGVAVVELTNS